MASYSAVYAQPSFPVGYGSYYPPPPPPCSTLAAVDPRAFARHAPPSPLPAALPHLTYTPQARKMARQSSVDSISSLAPSLGGGSADTTPRSPAVQVNYRHNPYNALSPIMVIDDAVERAADVVLPAATLHKKLLGKVEFVAYPSVRPKSPPPAPKKENLTRLFLGQLPYRVTDEQLQWICTLFCGSNSFFPERITREDRFGNRQLTGCVHLYTESAAADKLLKGLHKRVLFDDTGVWYARTSEQASALSAYCEQLRADKSLRPVKMPYTAVCAQKAHSTFVPTEEWSNNLGRVL